MKERLGVDVHGVIIEQWTEGDFLYTPSINGSFEALAFLNSDVFKGEVYLISKARSNFKEKTMDWLRENGFFKTTGIPEPKVYFCRKNEYKQMLCSELMITHFIDDQTDVLNHLKFSVPKLFLLNPNPGPLNNLGEDLNFWWTKNWQDLTVCLNRETGS